MGNGLRGSHRFVDLLVNAWEVFTEGSSETEGSEDVEADD